jgi:hypothetical protein
MIVNWNPLQDQILMTEQNYTTKDGETVEKDIQPEMITGITSAAVLMLHELGHVKQLVEGTSLVERFPELNSFLSKDTDIRGIFASVKNGIKNSLLPEDKTSEAMTRPDVILNEDDNLTRHERAAGDELEETPRTDYLNTGRNIKLTEEAQALEGIKAFYDLPIEERVRSKVSVDGAENPAVNTRDIVSWCIEIKTALVQFKESLSPTNWKRAKCEEYESSMDIIINHIKDLDILTSEAAVEKPQL